MESFFSGFQPVRQLWGVFSVSIDWFTLDTVSAAQQLNKFYIHDILFRTLMLREVERMNMLLRIAAQTFNLDYKRYASSGLKLNVDLGILNVFSENLNFNLIGSVILNVVLQTSSYTVILFICIQTCLSTNPMKVNFLLRTTEMHPRSILMINLKTIQF